MGVQGQGPPGSGGPQVGPTPATKRPTDAATVPSDNPADYNLYGDAVAAPGTGPDDPTNPKSPSYRPPAPPTTQPTPPPPPPQAQGILSDPGPYEIWASEHAGDFNDPSAAEDFYKKHGQDWANPSNIETLYGQGIGQLNPYYDYAAQMGTKSINDAAAAHGGFSSTALNQINLLNANLRGQQAKEMAGMATQADAARNARYGLGETEAQAADKGKLDRYGAESSIYGNWQDRETSRLTGGLTSQLHLSEDQAGQVDKFFTNLLQSGVYDAESINAALQAAGIDPNSAFGKDLISVGKAYATAYAGAAGKGAGS